MFVHSNPPFLDDKYQINHKSSTIVIESFQRSLTIGDSSSVATPPWRHGRPTAVPCLACRVRGLTLRRLSALRGGVGDSKAGVETAGVETAK
ncbi:hypothetical protein OAO87_02205 [bacterium]|nr:hypothetical protein [bacterium]